MRAARTPKALGLTFNTLESRLLRHILKQIITNYQITPQDLNPKAASVWYSAKGCESARMSPEETQEWLEHLHQYKSKEVSLPSPPRSEIKPSSNHCLLLFLWPRAFQQRRPNIMRGIVAAQAIIVGGQPEIIPLHSQAFHHTDRQMSNICKPMFNLL